MAPAATAALPTRAGLLPLLLALLLVWRWSSAPRCAPTSAQPFVTPTVLLEASASGKVLLWAAAVEDTDASGANGGGSAGGGTEWWAVLEQVRPPFTPATSDEASHLKPPKGATHLCVDIGPFATAPSAQTWWASHPNAFIVSVEANPVSYSLLARADRGSPPAGAVPRRCLDGISPACLEEPWAHIRRKRSLFAPLHAAVGFPLHGAGLATFRLGNANRSDVGSLLQFRRRYVRKTKAAMIGDAVVPLVTLSSLLRRLEGTCGTLTWDTLKIDAQGADHVVILSAFVDTTDAKEVKRDGNALMLRAYRNAAMSSAATADGNSFAISRFGCVVGEFTNRAYTSASTAATNASALFGFRYRRALRLAGFAEVDDRIWINARLAVVTEGLRTAAEFEKFAGRFTCIAADEQRRSSATFVKALEAYRDMHLSAHSSQP